jgi:hypothetical protein
MLPLGTPVDSKSGVLSNNSYQINTVACLVVHLWASP